MTLHVEHITPTQQQAIDRHKRLSRQISDHAKPDSPIECLSASARSIQTITVSVPIQPPALSERDRFGSPVDPAMTFDSFLTNASNTLVTAAVHHAIAEPAQFWPLVLHGQSGVGKTHLLQAVANSTESALYLSAEQVISHGAPLPEITFLPHRIILVDDLHLIRSRSAQGAFALLMNGLRLRMKGLIVSCEGPPCDLNFDDDIKSRLSGGLVLEIASHDRDLRFDLINRKFRAANVVIDQRCVSHLADGLKGGHALHGAVNRLIAESQLANITISMARVIALLLDNKLARETKRISVKHIQETVCRFHNVRLIDMNSARRTAQVVHPRQIAMYLARRLTLCSLPELGMRFGHRDHTTILHAFRKIEAMMERDADFKIEVEMLEQKILGEFS